MYGTSANIEMFISFVGPSYNIMIKSDIRK